jgi:hypothetical protein
MFTILDRLSWPGSADRANEDACGAAGDWAWVIDTSIFPGTAPILHPTSDAAWLAGFANERFTALAHEAQDGAALVKQVMQDARTAFFAVAPEERHDFVTWPVGALTLVRRHEGRLDVWTFADTTAYVREPSGPVKIIGEGPELRRLEAAKAAELLKATACTPATINEAPAFRAWLAERRERQRRGGGAPLLGLDPAAADRLRHQSVTCRPGTVVLLTSDGFSALVDLYGHVDAEGLVDTALKTGLEPLARAARRIETEIDPGGEHFPRFKLSDDATALLLNA